MRGVIRRVSAYLPVLMRTCLFDWKAVRSCYATEAATEDDQSVVGIRIGGGICFCLSVCLGVMVSCDIMPP